MEMQKVSRQMIEDAALLADLDREDAIYEDYSGRGMYGEKCLGIVGSGAECARFLVEITAADPDLGREMARKQREDSMGRDMIAYYPGIQLEEEGATA
jgi:hypothetical protein